MPRSIEELEKLLTPALNTDDHFTVEELALLIGEFALSDESLESVASNLKSETLLEKATILLSEHRIKQLIADEYDEIFYLVPHNNDILPKINLTMLMRYIDNFNPINRSQLAKLSWHTAMTSLTMEEEESIELAQHCFKKIVSVLMSPHLDSTSMFDSWLIEQLQNMVSQLIETPGMTDSVQNNFLNQLSPKCSQLLHDISHECSVQLIRATQQHQWPEVIRLIKQKSNLLQDIPNKFAVTGALKVAIQYEERDAILAILTLEGDNQPDDAELLSFMIEEEAASKILEQAAWFQEWELVLIILGKLTTFKRVPTENSLEHTLEQAAKSGQEDVIHVILNSVAPVGAASLTRALLYADKNKHWNTVLTLRSAQGLARTTHKSIFEATARAEWFIRQQRAPTSPSKLRFFEEIQPKQAPPRPRMPVNTAQGASDEFDDIELDELTELNI